LEPWYLYVGFIAFVIAMLLVDLKVFHGEAHEPSTRESALWVVFWIGLGVIFGIIVAVWKGGDAAGAYFAGFLIEKALSVDNMFVFIVIFGYFSVPKAYQHQVLFYGILGALVFRGLFIAAGVALIEQFEWVIYIFGAFLIFTAWRLARSTGEQVDPSKNKLLLLVRRFVPSTDGYRGHRVFVHEAGRRMATPIFAVLLVIASTDVVFAVDSIPAIFAITDEAFIVLAANIFAVMGLRAAYFVIVGALSRFQYLNYGLAVVLGLVGLKMLTSDVYHPPVWITLGAVVVVLGVAVLASLWATRDAEGEQTPPPAVRSPSG